MQYIYNNDEFLYLWWKSNYASILDPNPIDAICEGLMIPKAEAKGMLENAFSPYDEINGRITDPCLFEKQESGSAHFLWRCK